MIEKGEARLLCGIFFVARYEYIESSFSLHQRHVISLLIHGFLSVNARLLIAFGTAFYAITSYHKYRMITRVITLWRVFVTSLTTSVSTMCVVAKIMLTL